MGSDIFRAVRAAQHRTRSRAKAVRAKMDAGQPLTWADLTAPMRVALKRLADGFKTTGKPESEALVRRGLAAKVGDGPWYSITDTGKALVAASKVSP